MIDGACETKYRIDHYGVNEPTRGEFLLVHPEMNVAVFENPIAQQEQTNKCN